MILELVYIFQSIYILELDYTPIQISPDRSVSISGILDVGTNDNSAWNDATINVLKGRTISIDLADEDTERHFMGQQIYGIVKGLNTKIREVKIS